MREPDLLQAGCCGLLRMEGTIRLLHLHEPYSGDWHCSTDRCRGCNPAARQDSEEQSACAAAFRPQLAAAAGWRGVQWLLGSGLSRPWILDVGEELQSGCLCVPAALVVGGLIAGIQFDPYQHRFQHQSKVPWSDVCSDLVSSTDHICCICLLLLGY